MYVLRVYVTHLISQNILQKLVGYGYNDPTNYLKVAQFYVRWRHKIRKSNLTLNLNK